VNVRCFSDQRIEAIYAQIREAETVQAIARLRLVRAKKLKHVYLLGNLPVDILVDHLVSWEELMPSRLDHVFEQDGGIALTPTGLHLTRPDAFKDKKAAELARSKELGRDTATFETIVQQMLRVVVRFKRLRDGKPFGRIQEYLFKLPLAHGSESDAAVAPYPRDQIQHFLEHGRNGNGHGFGPIQIESITLAPPPAHLEPLDEANIPDPPEFPLHNL